MEQMATRLVRLTSLAFMLSVSSEALAHLRALPQLKRLSVDHVLFTASSPMHLNGLPITSISLLFTREVWGVASTWLSGAASGLEHFGVLNYVGCPSVPARYLPLHKAVHLTSLNLHMVEPDTTQLPAPTQLTKLSLIDCDMDDADVCRLSALIGLRSLDLRFNPRITGGQGSMEVLARSMPQLESLALLGTAARQAAQWAFQGRCLRLDIQF